MAKITYKNMKTATPAAVRKLEKTLTDGVGLTACGRWLVGEWLMARHAETKHGEWEKWVTKHFRRSTSIARRYIRQAKSFRVHLIKAAKVEKQT